MASSEDGMSEDAWPTPESDDLGRYLEDTITIDWQTPAVMEQGRVLLVDLADSEDRIRTLYDFVSHEIDHSLDHDTNVLTCSASHVLRERTGLCYAKSHLLAALLRYAGFPTGFCYARMASEEKPGEFFLHGFNAVYWMVSGSWIFMDPRGGSGQEKSVYRFEAPWDLTCRPDDSLGESFLPFIYRRPGKREIDLLERAPDLATAARNLPAML